MLQYDASIGPDTERNQQMNHNPRTGLGPEITETELRDVGLKSLNAFLIVTAKRTQRRT